MFTLAILIGMYSYIIFLIGLLGFLYKDVIVVGTLIYAFLSMLYIRIKFKDCNLGEEILNFVKKSTKFELLILFLILTQALVNLVGALGPELGFDALWYHLTLPKIYLESHRVFYIPGGLFYYSVMPKLTEMLYLTGLTLGSEIFPKLIHFSFGILSLIALYKLSRKYLSKTYSLLVVALFYSNLVVGWMSISAYVDLTRTFFELMALWGFMNWTEKKESRWLVASAIMLGFEISTKLLAVGSLLIFSVLIIFVCFHQKDNFKKIFNNLLGFWIVGLSIVLPWLIFSFINTGNPIYPFFTDAYPISPNFHLINPLRLSDPISPVYVIFLPISLFLYKKLEFSLKIFVIYSFSALVIWYLTPQTGGGRFILPYLSVLSLITIIAVKMINRRLLCNIFIGLILFMMVFSIIYRGVANLKYVPVVLGAESKSQFLTNHLNFSFGDFYDTDGYFAKTIKKGDRVLLYGFHNLYYVNFSFSDSSYAKKGDTFNYIAVQGGGNLPDKFRSRDLIYYNNLSKVKLYSLGRHWTY